MRNTDTSAATRARKRTVAVLRGGVIINVYASLKDCEKAMGIPHSRICEFARNGRIYKGGYTFKYL